MTQETVYDNALHYHLDDTTIDRLTGLFNRPTAEKFLEEYCYYAIAQKQSFTVALLDINNVTYVNEHYGHREGDHVIRFVAKQILEHVRNIELAARFSGDEFLLIFHETDRQVVHEDLQRLLHQLAMYKDAEYEVSFCYGLQNVSHEEHPRAKQIILDCDQAMYRWKRLFHVERKRQSNYRTYRESEDVQNFKFNEALLYKSLMQSTDDYIYVCDMKQDPTTFRYSKLMVDEFGLGNEVVHQAAKVWQQHIHPSDLQAFLEANQEISDGRAEHHNVEFRAQNVKGEWIWLRCRGHVERDYDGNPIFFAGFMTNLGKKNKIDPLTGLFNKFEFEDTIDRLTTMDPVKKFAVMLLDLDGFSYINKLYDHRMGDRVLQKTAQQIQLVLPEHAKMFRNDGDEFIIIFDYCEDEGLIKRTFTEIQEVLSTQQVLDGKRYHITISGGVLMYPDDASDLSSISKNMIQAMETSKHKGKNQLTFFQKHMLMNEMRELDMIEQLRYSIENDFEGFNIHFQPQVRASDGHIIGAEALARFHCDLYGDVPPLVFIPLLEKNGMIATVGKWIFETSVRYCSTWLQQGLHYGVSINLSYLQLTEKNFAAYMAATLARYNVDAHYIVVEMTESSIVKDDLHLHSIFQSIRKIGIRIAMDDFGTGYSSLEILKKSPADIVKIDKAFVKDILHSNFDATFIRFVVSLCHDVNITVLLEGVETREEYEKVRDMGLDFIQGYYFGRPMSFCKFMELLML